MKKTLALILVSSYLAALLLPMYPYIDFAINQEYIVAELCENKNEIGLECNGKCYLDNQLKKAKNSSENKNKSQLPKIEKHSLNSTKNFSDLKEYSTKTQRPILINNFILFDGFWNTDSPPPQLFS